ncbi:MAG: GUN4 domain-containing protein [Spirirestis rafaelensis WJT71-NPBG6]|nr:GUN4 domain-containing protein [Spirirestis rafaelensis WJT71-NPBG6]
MASLARGNTTKAVTELSQLAKAGDKLEVSGLNLSIPESLIRQIENNLRRYEEELLKVVKAQYPLDEFVRNELKKFQQYLGLRDEDVAQIEKPILDNKEVEYQEKLRQQQEAEKLRQQEEVQKLQRQREQQKAEQKRQKHENNLRRYEQELLKAVQAQYPLDEFVRNRLKKFQQSLGLRDEDVAQIEKAILDNKEVEYQEKLWQQQEAEKRRQEQVEAQRLQRQRKQQEAQRLQRQQKQQEAQRLQRQKQQTDDLPSEKGVDYIKLRDLLAAGKWKDADQETLAVMLKAAGTEEDYLNYHVIHYFPCTDLRTIDQLWIQYSKGLFGFSVQKRIYQSVGKDYDKFGDRVGWRKGMEKNKEWLTYNELTFSLNAPHGHLPLGGSYWGGNSLQFLYVGIGIGRKVYSGARRGLLFSRVGTCKV